MTDAEQRATISGLLDQILASADSESVRVDDILKALGARSYGALLLFASMIELVPALGAVPGMYIVVAVVVILLAGQLVFHRPEPWLPERIREATLSRQRLVGAIERARPWAKRLDRLVSPRLIFFLQPPFLQAIGLICILMAVLFFPLAFIPSSEKVLAAPVLIFGLALAANDGLLAAIGLVVTGGVVALPVLYWDEFTHSLSGLW